MDTHNGKEGARTLAVEAAVFRPETRRGCVKTRTSAHTEAQDPQVGNRSARGCIAKTLACLLPRANQNNGFGT
jgi:hypothetical protein